MDGGDIRCAEGFQKIRNRTGREFLIAGFNSDKEFVLGDFFEALPVEELMVEAGKAIQDEHSEDRCERGEENRKLKHHREKSGNREKIRGFSSYDEWVEKGGCSELHRDRGQKTGKTT